MLASAVKSEDNLKLTWIHTKLERSSNIYEEDFVGFLEVDSLMKLIPHISLL